MDLGAHLEVPTPEFLNIEEENDLNRKKIWKVLIKWKHRKGKGATLGILIDVLHKLKQTEAVDKLLGMKKGLACLVLDKAVTGFEYSSIKTDPCVIVNSVITSPISWREIISKRRE